VYRNLSRYTYRTLRQRIGRLATGLTGLYASRLIMRQAPVMEEDACQAQKGCRYDEAGHQEYG
jgi:hypothetical protein